jgi:transcription elongation factor Elf1
LDLSEAEILSKQRTLEDEIKEWELEEKSLELKLKDLRKRMDGHWGAIRALIKASANTNQIGLFEPPPAATHEDFALCSAGPEHDWQNKETGEFIVDACTACGLQRSCEAPQVEGAIPTYSYVFPTAEPQATEALQESVEASEQEQEAEA